MASHSTESMRRIYWYLKWHLELTFLQSEIYEQGLLVTKPRLDQHLLQVLHIKQGSKQSKEKTKRTTATEATNIALNLCRCRNISLNDLEKMILYIK